MHSSDDLIQHDLDLRNIGRVQVALNPSAEGRCVAFIYGEPIDGCLVRLQSRCLYGEVFDSVDCDCRDQLDESWRRIREAGTGVVVYLDQEGRACGLVTKARAYRVTQSSGKDTFAAYTELGVSPDARTYADAADLLLLLGLRRVRLLTNNPKKIEGLASEGIVVERTGLVIPASESTRLYLEAKRARGHLL